MLAHDLTLACGARWNDKYYLVHADNSSKPAKEDLPDPGGRPVTTQTTEVGVHHQHTSNRRQG